MDYKFLYSYLYYFERVLSVARSRNYSLLAVEKYISNSSYFQAIEDDVNNSSPVTTDVDLINSIFIDIKVDLTKVPHYNKCLWAAEAYLRIQAETCFTFETIFLYIPIKKMYEYFILYHEMDYSKIISLFWELYKKESVLSLLIKQYNFSLIYISTETGFSYSTLSALKTRQRKIGSLNVHDLLKLSKLLHVRAETLSEFQIK